MKNDSAHTGWLAGALAAAALLLVSTVPMVSAEQASSDLRRAQSGYLDAGDEHTCAVLADRSVRCWGRGLAGRLGYGSEDNVLSGGGGGPVDPAPGRGARAIVAGDFHTCAVLDDGSARCWGFGANGRLGYGNSANVLSPATAPAIDLGPGRTATAITAGASHTCAILDTGAVRCWGNGVSGRLGYGDQRSIGDDETPAAVGTVDIGAGRTAVAISAGDFHTCVIRDDAQLVCWGFGSGGQLGYGGTSDVGDDETPGAAGPVNLGPRRVRAVSGGKGHTCAILDDGSARCWGFGADGRLGYGGTASITSAVAATSINLGSGRTAVAIAAGEAHSCAILDTGAVRCWGFGGNGRLGTGATDSIANDPGETPSSVAPVDLGPGRMGRAITVGFSHTCVLVDDATVRCWGFGGSGRLGYGNETSVGDSPARSVLLAGPVPLGAAVAPSVADLSLGLSASAGSIPIGGAVSLTVSLVNRGPDATDGVTVGMPAPAGLVYRAAAASQGSFAEPTGLWTVGALPPGGSAALTVSVTADSPGTRTVVAEVASSAVLDPTSTPGNGAPEDDRAAVTLVVPAIAGPAPTVRRLPQKLGLKVVRAPKRGLAKRLVVTGVLTLPSGTPRLRCAGKVRVRALVGKRAVASSTVALRARRGTCVYARTLRPTRTGSAKVARVSATFLGTALMRPRASKSVRVLIR